MQVIFKKLNPSTHQLKIIRSDRSVETTQLNTATYQLHDICHFFVEQTLKTREGFWGMLAQGYKLEQLSGKENALTAKLRLIEGIVGATQSVYMKRMNRNDFWSYIETITLDVNDPSFLDIVLPQIDDFMQTWKYLPVGEEIHLVLEV